MAGQRETVTARDPGDPDALAAAAGVTTEGGATDVEGDDLVGAAGRVVDRSDRGSRRPRAKRRPARRAETSTPLVLSERPRLTAGWRVVAAKEFADHLLSVRFVVLVAILGLAAIAAVYSAASGIRSVAPSATGVPNLFLSLFTLAPGQVPSFLAIIGFLAPLLGIAYGFDSVNGERGEGTLPRLLSQPIHRDDVVNGKFVAGLAIIGLILVAIVLLVAGVGMFELGIVPQPEEIIRLGLWVAVSVVYVGLWLAFAMLCSVALRRAATSALLPIALWLVVTLFADLLVGVMADAIAPVPTQATLDQQVANAQAQQTLSDLSPTTLYSDATQVLLDPTIRTVGVVVQSQADRAVPTIMSLDQSLLIVWPEIVALVALTVICFGGTYVLLMRQEVRA